MLLCIVFEIKYWMNTVGSCYNGLFLLFQQIRYGTGR